MSPAPFELSGVVHLIRPVGEQAMDLEALRASLERVPDTSLFYHTAGRALRHPAVDELPLDDLSAWVAGVLHEREVAERLSFAVDGCEQPAQELRQALIAVLDAVPERLKAHAAPPGGALTFLAADSVRVEGGARAANAASLLSELAAADDSVWFFHLIEEPWFAPGPGALIEWLLAQDAGGLARTLDQAGRSGQPLTRIRQQVLRRWNMTRLAERLTRAAGDTEDERREAGRETVARLVRRLPRAGGES